MEGPFVGGSIGSFVCGILTSGELHCWDVNDPSDPRLDPFVPSGQFTAVCVNDATAWACAIGVDGHPTCFAAPDATPTNIVEVPDVTLTQISCGLSHACGVTPDHTIVCWGDTSHGQGTPPS